jgi:hypothetical protein
MHAGGFFRLNILRCSDEELLSINYCPCYCYHCPVTYCFYRADR